MKLGALTFLLLLLRSLEQSATSYQPSQDLPMTLLIFSWEKISEKVASKPFRQARLSSIAKIAKRSPLIPATLGELLFTLEPPNLNFFFAVDPRSSTTTKKSINRQKLAQRSSLSSTFFPSNSVKPLHSLPPATP